MAENENAQHQDNQQPQQEAAPEPVFQLQRCYLKDASLEMPHAPEILLQAQQEQPQVDIKFEVSQKTVAEALYDVTVRGTITVKAADKVIILVEGTQSGLFAIHGIPVEALQHVTNVVCPAMVYPYLRANLADLMNRANVPPVHLPEVNFEVLYQQRLAQAQAEAEAPLRPDRYFDSPAKGSLRAAFRFFRCWRAGVLKQNAAGDVGTMERLFKNCSTPNLPSSPALPHLSRSRSRD